MCKATGSMHSLFGYWKQPWGLSLSRLRSWLSHLSTWHISSVHQIPGLMVNVERKTRWTRAGGGCWRLGLRRNKQAAFPILTLRCFRNEEARQPQPSPQVILAMLHPQTIPHHVRCSSQQAWCDQTSLHQSTNVFSPLYQDSPLHCLAKCLILLWFTLSPMAFHLRFLCKPVGASPTCEISESISFLLYLTILSTLYSKKKNHPWVIC